MTAAASPVPGPFAALAPDRGCLFAAWCGLPAPAVPAALARGTGFDVVVLDMQHGAIDFAAAVEAVPLVAAAGKPAIVRIPVGATATASRLLDAGAAGIIAPMVNSAADAEAFVAAVKYPPVGERSWGPGGAVAIAGVDGPTYFARANGWTVALAMVETREALDRLDEILAVPGLDGIFIGPSDLSISLSGGDRLDPEGDEVHAAIDRALAAAKGAGRRAGIYAITGERAADYRRRGFDLVAIAGDGHYLRAGAEHCLAAARG